MQYQKNVSEWSWRASRLFKYQTNNAVQVLSVCLTCQTDQFGALGSTWRCISLYLGSLVDAWGGIWDQFGALGITWGRISSVFGTPGDVFATPGKYLGTYVLSNVENNGSIDLNRCFSMPKGYQQAPKKQPKGPLWDIYVPECS